MKIRTKKKGMFIMRRQHSTDKTHSISDSFKLAYYLLQRKKAYIIKARGRNDVMYVSQNRKGAKELLKFLNS